MFLLCLCITMGEINQCETEPWVDVVEQFVTEEWIKLKDSILFKIAVQLTQDLHNAEDLFNDIVLRALRYKEKFKEWNVRGRVITIMRNTFINNYRKKKHRGTSLVDPSSDFFYNCWWSVENTAMWSMWEKELLWFIDDLPESLFTPFVMYYTWLKYQEIADIFDIPLWTIKSRIFFARKKLKAKVREEYPNIEFPSDNKRKTVD